MKKKTKKAAEKKKKTWYEPRINSNIYVKGEKIQNFQELWINLCLCNFSLGLPEDITMEELKEFFGKAGVLRFDSKSGYNGFFFSKPNFS